MTERLLNIDPSLGGKNGKRDYSSAKEGLIEIVRGSKVVRDDLI